MDNEEHLKILKQGREVWNEWRKQNARIVPDLSGESLAYSHFESSMRNQRKLRRKLGKTRLTEEQSRELLTSSYLNSINFSGTLLRETKFERVSARYADFCDAYLRNAVFRDADLRNARFERADLTGADLRGAVLSETEFTNAQVHGTIFSEIDLGSAIGLETVRHFGPSTIGIDTIYKSKGNIPEVFLRGAGVPEDFITYMKSLVGKAIEFYSCFISYSSKDDDFARRLHADLQQNNVRVWFAPEDLKIGDRFRTRIDESIRIYDKLMVVLSANSIQSSWVEEEVEAALEKERKENKLVLFPIRLDDAVMDTQQAWAASLRRTRHLGDFRNWKDHDSFKKAFGRLLPDLKAEKTVASDRAGSPERVRAGDRCGMAGGNARRAVKAHCVQVEMGG